MLGTLFLGSHLPENLVIFRMKKTHLILLILILVIPLLCVVAILAGVLGFRFISETSASALTHPNKSAADIEAEVQAIATDYAGNNDLEVARGRLHELGMPNPEQYLSYILDQYIAEGRGPEDEQAANILKLADALGVTTPSMLAALSTATPVPTPTLPATSTPTLTITPLPTDTALPTTTSAPATDTPVPTDTAMPPTNTPGPPTDTPVPTDTPAPTPPPVDFVVADQRILTIEENGGCRGSHNIFVSVLDAAGNPLDNVSVEDTFQAVPPKLSGEKGPGKLEYDLWKNGFSLHVIKKEDGSPATSQTTDKLSSVDGDIPSEWLVQAHYCTDVNDCNVRKGINQLCLGHYSYYVTFQKTY